MKTAFPNALSITSVRLYSNIPFDNTYQHHSLISSLFKYNNTKLYSGVDLGLLCERFINRKDYTQTGSPYYYPRYDFLTNFNFDYNNGLNATLRLELTSEQTNANYLRLQVGNSAPYTYYYYFITGIKQSNADTYTLTLELDVLMTYQDEFLNGMKDVPVFTERKHSHRYTSDGLRPYCCDLKTGEQAFAGVKPSLVKKHYQTSFNNSNMKKLEGIMWLYMCCDLGSHVSDYPENLLYSCLGKTYPLIMLAVPININSLKYVGSGDAVLGTYSADDLNVIVNLMVGSGYVHGAKVSPYPPFKSANSITYSGGDLTIKGTHTDISATIKKFKLGNNTFIISSHSTPAITTTMLMMRGCIAIIDQKDINYTYDDINLELNNLASPSVTYNRYLDPKLLFSPFRKYVLNAQYCTNGYEIYPELLYSQNATSSGDLLTLITYTTSYIGDNNIITLPYFGSTDIYNYCEYEKIGLSSAMNYTFPVGTNALDVFNATQRESFYTSKVATGITSGLSILAGGGSLALGIAGLAGAPFTSGMSAVASVGLIAGGAGALVGGVAGEITNAVSISAKMEDLKNTPDSINISGSNFIFDDAVAGSSYGLPYVDVYDVGNAIKETADDFFYNYGYQVSRECYFNQEIKIDNTTNNYVDNNIFGRSIFNYVKINEDITTKINANIPYIVKQKLSSIFNNGITLWSFFGFGQMWAVTPPASPDSAYYLDKWFMKCTYDNTEYTHETHN